ncbi:PLD nuclease N-terminal domain-containing protein [Angustibacter peucedani]
MIRFVLPLVEIGLLVYCLIDCIQTDSSRVRNLPKVAWILLIIILPLIGGIAWLVAGRPERTTASRAPWLATRTSGFPEYERPPRGPDDDPDFLRQIRQVDEEHERTLKQWEDDLRRREQELRGDGTEPPSPGGSPGASPDDGTDPGPQDDPPAAGSPR